MNSRNDTISQVQLCKLLMTFFMASHLDHDSMVTTVAVLGRK